MINFKKVAFSFISVLMITQVIIGQHYKAMSFNIRYDNTWDKEHSWHDRKQGVINILKKYKLDVFGIQEGLLNQVNYIAKNLKDYHYIGVGRDDGKTKGEYSPLFYNYKKFELLQSGTFWLSKTPEKPSKGWDAALNRICTYGLFMLHKAGDEFWVFNTHFDHKGSVARLNSAQLILDKIRTLNTNNYPVILMGDFNDTPDKAPIKLLKDNLIDAKIIAKNTFNGSGGTFNGFNNLQTKTRIDYFFVKKVKVLKYTHVTQMSANNKFVSDHFPIFIRFDLEK
ncbi:MAG: endonuclease/exonuclease/phosphatase family protein [Flavobacteriaceae bacterium]